MSSVSSVSSVSPMSSPPAGPGVWLLRVVGLGLLVVAVALGAVSLVGDFFQQSRQEPHGPFTANRVAVDVTIGDVVVHQDETATQVAVRTTTRWAFGSPDSTVTLDGGTVRVAGHCPTGLSLGGCSVDVDVTVPPGVAVDVASTSGDIRLDDLSGAVDVRTTSGDVRANGLRTPDLRLTSTAGTLDARFVTAPDAVRVNATTGDVTLRLPPSATYRLDVRTTVGERTVGLQDDASSARTVQVSTTLGDVTVEAG